MEDAMTKFALLAAAAATVSSAALAADSIAIDAPHTAVVRLGDLDLTSVRGRSLLERRIADAIEEVCGSYANVTEPSEMDNIGSCRIAAKQSAESQLAGRSSTLKLAAANHRR
jgi:UrcA family protein